MALKQQPAFTQKSQVGNGLSKTDKNIYLTTKEPKQPRSIKKKLLNFIVILETAVCAAFELHCIIQSCFYYLT